MLKSPSFARWHHKALHVALSTILMVSQQLNPFKVAREVRWGQDGSASA